MDFDVKIFEIKSEEQLFRIPDFTQDILNTDSSVREAGVFKVVLPANLRGEGTTLQELIALSDERLSVAEKQKVVKFNNCPNLYGHRATGTKFDSEFCTPEEVRDFVQTVKNPDNFNFESCCSTILENDGPDSLLDHYFNDVIKCQLACSVKAVSKKRASVSASLAQGKRDASNLEKYKTGLNAMTPSERLIHIEKALLADKRPKMEDCDCEGCINDSGVFSKANQHVMYGKGVEVTVSDRIRMTSHFGLFCLSSTSILRLLQHNFPGITLPFLYYGTAHSFFPAHIEDFSLFSWNYLHFGKPKVWIVVPPTFAFKLTKCTMDQAPNMFHSSCYNLLGHKYFLPSPQWLKDMDIPFKIVVQKEGESVVVCPNAVHFGWNCGISVAEACNFATAGWLPYGIVAPQCACLEYSVHMDLRRLVAAVRPDLLKCFLNKAIPEGEDEFFYKSILRAHEMNVQCQNDIPQISFEPKSESDGNADDDDADSDVFPELPKKRRGRKIVTCPKAICSQQYKYGSKEKLKRHINNVHRGDNDFHETLKKFKLMFPERNKVPKKKCDLCWRLIAGRGAQMKKHQNTDSCKSNRK